MGAHGGGRMPGVRGGGGGGMGALKHFCRGGEPKKAPHNNKKDPPHRENSSRKALTCMVKKAPPMKGKTYQNSPTIIRKAHLLQGEKRNRRPPHRKIVAKRHGEKGPH